MALATPAIGASYSAAPAHGRQNQRWVSGIYLFSLGHCLGTWAWAYVSRLLYDVLAVWYRARQCRNDDCRLRFPVTEQSALGQTCPICGADAPFVGVRYRTYGAQEPAEAGAAESGLRQGRSRAPVVDALLDNLRSLGNLGSIFRTADGAGVRRLYLGGFTATPDHPKMPKTALGAERAVAWSQHRNAIALAGHLRDAGARLWALESGPQAVPFFGHLRQWSRARAESVRQTDAEPVVLVVGNEVSGVDPGLLELCHHVLSLPMVGIKESLNVGVAFGIAVYALRWGRELG